jgi:hypothetical protein
VGVSGGKMAAMIWSSVHVPMPAWRSGQMFVE